MIGTKTAPSWGSRVLVAAAQAGFGSLALHALPGLSAGDPLYPALMPIPWLVAALGLMLGPRPRRTVDFEGFALLALVAVVAQRSALAPTLLDRFLVVALVILLVVYGARYLPTLRRRLGRRLPSRPSAIFFGVPFVVYVALLPLSTAQRPPDGDEPYYLLLTHSLAFDLDSDLANNYANGDWHGFLDRVIEPQPGDPRGDDGTVYSRHNLLLPLVLAPFYRLAGLWGVLVAMAAMAAATSWMLLRVAHSLMPDRPRGALFAYLLLAFSPPLLLYSHQVWIEVPAALLLMIAVDRLWRGRRQAVRRIDVAVFAGALALLPLLKLRLGLFALMLLALAWRDARAAGTKRSASRVARIAAAALVGTLVVIMGLNQLRFANPLKMHRWEELRVIDQPLSSFVLGGLGMFYDVAFGLFASAPAWLLLLPAAWLCVRRQRRLAIDLLVIAGPYLLLVAPRFEWYGGWSPPFRYGVVTLPLFSLLLIPLLDRPRARTMAVVHGLGAVTVALTAIWLAVPGWTYSLASGTTHMIDAVGLRLNADLARFFPSMVRPRLATWLWPLLSLLLIPLTLGRGPVVRGLRGARRRDRAAAWGAAVLLLLLVSLTLAVHRVPTRTVELEDGWLLHRGGSLHPPPWTIERPRYRGGWLLGPGARVSAAVVGEGPVVLRVALRYVENDFDPDFEITLAANEEVLHRIEPSVSPPWQTIEIGPVVWPKGSWLVIDGPPAKPGRRNGVVVDYVDFDWQ